MELSFIIYVNTGEEFSTIQMKAAQKNPKYLESYGYPWGDDRIYIP